MKSRILILTKDAMCKSYLPVYGNQYWSGKTPNIDELAAKGTVFDKFYTSAPSTVMAFRGIVTGKFAHETPFSDYIPMEIPESDEDIFNYATKLGYSSHLMWDAKWEHMVLRYGNCFGKSTVIHNVKGLNQPVGPHCDHNGRLCDDDILLRKTISVLEEGVREICESEDKIFLWLHLPHVLMGRTGYGEDMDAFDLCVGMLRKYFDDDSIWISADHGNMDGYNGKFSYGFDVYTSAIQIPLISPRIGGLKRCDTIVSNVDMRSIVFEGRIPRRKYIYSDCAYYAQPHRKIAIIANDFAYIYNKKGKKEELYDLIYDPNERCNMADDYFFDTDRKLKTMTSEVYFTPRWDERDLYLSGFREELQKIWKNPSLIVDIRGRLLSIAKKVYVISRDRAILPVINKLSLDKRGTK